MSKYYNFVQDSIITQCKYCIARLQYTYKLLHYKNIPVKPDEFIHMNKNSKENAANSFTFTNSLVVIQTVQGVWDKTLNLRM